MTLSTPVKIVALAALALLLGMGGLLALSAARHKGTPAAIASPPRVAPAKLQVRVVVTKPHRTLAQRFPGVPTVVARALAQRPTVVVVVYSSAVASDRSVLEAARAGAHAAHAGFVAADVSLEPIAAGVATWSGSPAVPAVGVVRRPGKVVWQVSGPTDRQTVAQAVTSAR